MQSLLDTFGQSTSCGLDSEQRGESDDARYPKEAIATTLLKIDHFNERLGAIRKQIAERRQDQLHPLAAVDAWQRNNANVDDARLARVQATTPLDTASYEPITLPRLPNGVGPVRVTEPHFDGRLLAMDALRSRELSKHQYDSAWETLQRAEQDAAASVQDAERLTEEARIAMVLYTKNERSWNFDERARRYQEVMQAKKEAEGARLKADDDRIVVQCQRSQLVDPYRSLRSRKSHLHGQANANALEPIIPSNQETVYVWILASPLLTLPFTPRESTPGSVLAGEKELSTHVVYYAATSAMQVVASDNGSSENDKPPSDGWLCCTAHGVMPPPIITLVTASVETWLVSEAGATHLNGKYLFSGTHNGTRKFKSAAGVELFRKELPKTSKIISGFTDAASNPVDESHSENSIGASGNQSDQVPSILRPLEQNENDFQSMEKIGAWMSNDTMLQKQRRLRDSTSGRPDRPQDGDHILTQETSSQRLDPTDVVLSRPAASAELCREWVLFMRCSRRVDQPMSDAPKQNFGLGCLKRHYYISVSEKEAMTTWAHEQEAWLEKAVLSAIIRREASLQRVSRLCQKCMSKFQQDLREETEVAVNKILRELNTIRFLTVKVLEVIEVWRSHARKRGSTRYESGGEIDSSRLSNLGWFASITVKTGRLLFKSSHAFVSKFKRFCRPEDPHGQPERRLVFLGSFSTRDEAELAYDEFANAEARRLNTTVAHLPRRRNVFRSCGKHFSVESERLGPDYCIECAGKQLSTGSGSTSGVSTSDEWNPPFFFPSGRNYILKLANDLDFLDQVLPLKNRLSNQPSTTSDTIRIGAFPLLGNVFLLPRTPIEDPDLVFFTSLNGSGSIPCLRGSINNQHDEEDELMEEALDVDRILKAQQVFVQEMQIYHPDLFQRTVLDDATNQHEGTQQSVRKRIQDNPENARRIVQALYWDRCAALRIEQERAPLPFRQPNVWCRPDAGEWASLLVRGRHQQHILFENRLTKAGKETQERRKKTLKLIRKLLKTPIYFIPSRDIIRAVIAEGEHVKGDVVLLEVKSAYKLLDKYDVWCSKARHVQRWYRGVRGRRRARATQRALHFARFARKKYFETVSTVSTEFYTQVVVPGALRAATRKLRQPVYSRTVKIDGELLVVCIHATDSIPAPPELSQHSSRPKSSMCRWCARRFHVIAKYEPRADTFQVASPVCCCLLNNPTKNSWESWVIRAYNPLSNVIYRLVIQNELVTQLLQSQRVLKEETSAKRNAYNPLFTCKAMTKSVEDAASFGNYVDALARRAFDEWTSWSILSDEATQRRKTAEIDLERARERVVDLAKCFEVAIGDARRALDFESRPFEEAQAWDPLENANDWRFLVHKRHTQKELASAVVEADRCRFELFQAKASESYLRVESGHRRTTYESYWRRLVEQQQAVVNARTMELETHRAKAVRIMAQVCTVWLALRDTFFAPTRRALVIAPTMWRREDIAMGRMLMIAVPGLQRGRNTLRRRALQLSDLGNNSGRRCQRFIVDVSAWTSRSNAEAGETRNIWVTAYDPVTAHSQRVYLEWELVQLLASAAVVRRTQTSGRDRWARIADKLLSLCMLDRFTGAFTLRKLQFYHHLRLLQPHFLASRWFQDLKRGRKCGDGDEIFRQSVTISGKLCIAVVYENWGDLVVRVYRSSSAKVSHLRVPLDLVFKLLSQKPLSLHLWICCLKSNRYAAAVITTILKFLRFADSDDELTAVAQADVSAPDAVNTLCIAAKIQQRRVVLRFRNTTGGDVEIRAYDISHNQTFHLHLEWETIRRVLKSCHQSASSSCTARRRNLTLTRNRRELCAWITSRLQFQSLLEHPEVLASSVSPLVSGVQVRSSFLLFNEWISNSVRNPLRAIPQAHIDRFAATANASLFHGLAHEQLAFVAQTQLPYSYDKALIDTRDYIISGTVAAELGPSARQLKVDIYTTTHQLYARVRREIAQETISRHEREERQYMEKEEGLALRQDILEACGSARSDHVKCCVALRTAKQNIDIRILKTEPLFDELIKYMTEKIVAQGKKRPAVRKPKVHAGTRDEDQIDVRAVVLKLLASACQHNDGGVYAILVRQSFGFHGTLRNLARQIELVEAYLETVSMPAFKVLDDHAKEVVEQDASLVLLQSIRLNLLNSRRYSSLVDRESEPSNDGAIVEEEMMQSPAAIPQSEVLSCVEVEASRSDLASAFLLQATGATEEVRIGSSLFFSGQSFSDIATTVARELTSIFRRVVGGRRMSSVMQLHVKRVPLGLIVFDTLWSIDASTRSCPWNARATALALEPVAGLAVFMPNMEVLCASAFHTAESLYQSLTSVVPHEILKMARTSSSSIGAARRRTVQRSKQLLPWKQLSVERMQTARRLRQQRQRHGLVIRATDEDREREEGTLAIYTTSGHHIEWLLGDGRAHHLDASAVTAFVDSLRLRRAEQWILSLDGENQLQLLFDEPQRRQLVPSELATSALCFDHVRIDADDWRHPKRLIFSCKELQSRQHYFVDCSFTQLVQQHSRDEVQGSVHWRGPHLPLPVAASRTLALAAANKLIFCCKNGAWGLHLMEPAHQTALPLSPSETSALTSILPRRLSEVETVGELVGLPELPPLQHIREFELQRAIHRCRWRRYMKHQSSIRRVAVVRQWEQTHAAMLTRQLPLEWSQMIQEDWLAQEHRGVLTLDEKEVKKLTQAWGRVHQRRLGSKDGSTGTVTDVAQWLLDVDKEMGAKDHEKNSAAETIARFERQAQQFLSAMEKKNWWLDKHAKDEPLTVDSADIAEWWRQQRHC